MCGCVDVQVVRKNEDDGSSKGNGVVRSRVTFTVDLPRKCFGFTDGERVDVVLISPFCPQTSEYILQHHFAHTRDVRHCSAFQREG